MKGFALALVLLPLTASAATITVNTTADRTVIGDGQCTLREAIANVNAAADATQGDCVAGSGIGDTIVFNLTLPATIKLHRGPLTIANDVAILGAGRSVLIIDGLKRTRVFHIAAGTTAMSDLTIQNGRDKSTYGYARGGGILLDSGAAVHLSNCDVLGNTATTGPRVVINGSMGGGIYIATAATATFTNSTISGNTASTRTRRLQYYPLDRGGGGIFVDSGGTALLTDCIISGNISGLAGGGIYNSGTLTLTNCTLDGNLARFSGGGIHNDGIASLTNTTLSGNQSVRTPLDDPFYSGAPRDGGGVENSGTATLTNCTLSDNIAQRYGGGIHNSGTATLTGCTLQENTGISGGGMMNSGTATLTSSTISRNFAPGDFLSFPGGGGLMNTGTATLDECALTDNSSGYRGGGIHNGGGFYYYGIHPVLMLINSTISGNSAYDGGGAIMNADSDATLIGCTLSGNRAGSDTRFGWGGGIASLALQGDACLTVINTIVALNTPQDLRGDFNCFSAASDLIATDPLLAPLGDYGGPTQTLALCTGPGTPDSSCTGASPAIDAGDDSVTGPPDNVTTDQRGLPRLSGAHVDIGAYEVQQ